MKVGCVFFNGFYEKNEGSALIEFSFSWLWLLSLLFVLIVWFVPGQINAQGFETLTNLPPVAATKNTGEKPQSKVWTYAGKWWTVSPNNSGTWIWRLDGVSWTNVFLISSSNTRKADCKVVDDVCHILLLSESSTSQLVSVEYDPGTSNYKFWTDKPSPAVTTISLDNGVETATIDVDGTSRMWLASDGISDVRVRWSDPPYSSWSNPIVIATGITDDDISVVTALPVQGQVGVLWSNQTTKRFGFKTHIDGTNPAAWSVDEVPASQSAVNIGSGMADDHMNLALASDGTLYCAVKTSYDTPGYPNISLLKRHPSGTWDNLYPISETGTRAIVILNEAIGKLKVVYASIEGGGNILYRESSTSTILFGSPSTLMSGFYSNPTSTKDNYDSEIVILASDASSASNTSFSGVLATDYSPLTVPDIPSLYSPALLATEIVTNPTLSWNTSANATSYDVQVSTTSDFSSALVDENEVETTLLQVSGLSNNTIYYWRVRAVNSVGSSNWSPTWSFTTTGSAIPLPAVPMLLSPSNASTGVATSPTLSWNVATNASSYQVQVSSVSDFSSTLFDESNLSTISFPITGLSNNELYYWRVLSMNSTGNSEWSATWNFTTIPLPSEPTLLSPVNSATEIATNPTLSWNAATNASYYHVQVSAVSDFSSLVVDESDIATTSFTVTGLGNNTVYYWRVQSLNSSGISAWSPTWIFTTIPLPSIPTLVSPIDLTTGLVINPTLSWNASTNATSYQVQVSVVSNFSTLITDQNVPATSLLLTGLNANTLYYWRVRAINSGGESGWSSVWRFTTIPLPAVPTLLNPFNTATGVTINPILSWNTSTNATSYQLQVSTRANMSQAFVDENGITATSFQINGLNANTLYYWRVRAINSAGNSAWSSIWNFTTVPLPSAPTLLSPDNGATDVAINPTLSWNASPNASTYQVQVSVLSNFSSTVIDQNNVPATSLQIGLNNSTVYYWRVRSTNVAGSSAWSTAMSFTTIMALPSVPALITPADAANDVAINTMLIWNASTNATTYEIQVSTTSDFSVLIDDEIGIATTSFQVSNLTNSTVYFWRVRSTNIAGSSPWSTARSFTTIIALPSVPILLFPANAATDVAINPTLSWNASSNATSYQVQVSTVSDFSTLVADEIVVTTSFPATSLSNSVVYYWRVRASNADGSSAWSEIRNFTTIITLPSVPTLLSPANAATDVAINPTLSWNAATNASTYQVQVSAQSDFSSTIIDQSNVMATSLPITGLNNSTIYYWRVRSTNVAGSSAWSTARSFTTIIALPSVPTLLSPANSSTDVAINPILSWNASTNASSYQVQVSIASDFSALINEAIGIATTSFQVNSLSNSTVYYWRVRATNVAGSSAWSGTRSFTTIITLPSVPTLLSPAIAATDVAINPTLSWNAATNASTYQVQVSTASDFSTLMNDEIGIATTSFQLAGLSNSIVYYWRVRSTNVAGSSAWSTARSFTTIIALPSVPTLLSPANAATDVAINPTLSWNATTNASTYQVQVSTASDFSALINDEIGIATTSFQVNSLSNSTVYYWRVSATNVAGSSAWSTTRSFTTIIALPSIPTLLSPANVATDVAINPTLSWNAATNASTYQVQVSTASDFSALTNDEIGIAITSFQATGLSNSTVYYWRVRATNVAGSSSWSTARSFTTIIALPSTPTLLSPAIAATDVAINPTLSWNTAANASNYQVQVSEQSDFSSTIIDQNNVAATSLQITGLNNSTIYYWRVRATNVAGSSTWSGARSFTTIIALPSVPTLLSPANVATDVAINPTLSWNAATNASTYQVQVSTASDFSSLINDAIGIATTSFQVTDLTNSTVYYWRVRATNVAGSSAWSGARNFTTIITLPSVPTLLSPTNVATDVAINPTLSWYAATNASTYQVQVSAQSDFSSTIIDQSNVLTSLPITGLNNSTIYYWRVRSTNVAGSSAWSTARSFTTIIALPSVPTLLSPANAATDVAINPTLSWSAATNASTYQVQVSTASDFSALMIDAIGIATTSFQVTGLNNSTVYYWRVSATNVAGSSAWSTTRNFTTIIALPSVPTLLSPANASTDVAINPILGWNAATNASSYQVQVSIASDFSALINDAIGVAITSFQVTGLSNSTVYYWRVRATNVAGSSAWSTARSFTTIIALPSVPTLLSPANSSTDVAINPILSWNASTNASSYQVQVSTASDFSALINDEIGIATTSFQVTGLSNSTVYYWRVRATNVAGSSAWSGTRSFTTIIALPSVPTLLSPANVATDVVINPIVSWNASTNAASYQAQISTTSDFSTLIADESEISITSYQATALDNSTVYYWRVRAINVGGSSAWSEARSFTTVVALPSVPPLLSPANAATDVAIDPILSWNSVIDASSYQVQVSTISDFSTTVTDQSNVTATSFHVTGLDNSTIYYWRIRATNAAGSTEWSTPISFTTIIALPSIPALTSPANAATDVAINPTLSWNAATNASTYEVQVSIESDFSTLVADESGTATTSFQLTDLSNSTVYYWRVRAANVAGSSAWSTASNFTTIVELPSVPILLSPANAANDVVTNPTLSWDATTNASMYQVQLSEQSDFSSTFIDQGNVTATSLQINGLNNSTVYYWRVRATNVAGSSVWSTASNFTTIVELPSVPILLSPANAANDVVTNPTLSWDAATNASMYQVQVSEQSDFSSTIIDHSNVTAESLLITDLKNSTIYYWRVRSTNIAGSSAWSTPRNFTTIIVLPSVPTLLSPANAATDIAINPTLSWNNSMNASTYEVQVSTSSDFSILIVNQNGMTPASIQVNGLNNSTIYYWRVRSTNVAGSSAWSGVWSFTTIITLPSVPTLLSPVNSITDVAINPILNWSPSTNASTYELQVSEQSDFSSTFIEQNNVTATSFQINGLNNSTVYYWRVRAVNFAGSSAWSGARSFSTIIALPSVPTLLLPTHAATDVTINPSLSWSTSINATSFEVQISSQSDFSSMAVNQSNVISTFLQVIGLNKSMIYYWRVRATNLAGNSAWSDVRSFSTIDKTLVGNWKMNEGSGTTLIDDSRFGNHAATQGNPIWVADISSGLALRLNGINQFATVSDASSLDVSHEITLSAWIRPEQRSSQQIIQKGSMVDGYELSLLSSGEISFQFNQGAYRLNSNSEYPSDGITWMHIVATYNGTMSKIYINGMENKTLTITPAVFIGFNDMPLTIGAKNDGTNLFKGAIDDLRVYNYALTDIEILEMFSNSDNITGVKKDLKKIGLNEQQIQVYPNPADDILFLEFHDESDANYSISIIDLHGRTYYSASSQIENHKIEINLAKMDLIPGLHFLVIRSVDSSESRVIKFIKN